MLGQRLNDAAAMGDLQAVLAALLDGANPAWRDQHQRSAIIATIYGTTSNNLPTTPASFEEATQSRPEHASILRVLLRHILSRAVSDSSEPSNRVMFDELVDRPQEGPWLRGITPLALAAYLGKAELVQVMLEEGADVDARDANGATAIMYAARDGRADVAEVLLNFDARPQLEDINAWNAERYGRAHPAIVQLLAQHQKDTSGVVSAAGVFPAGLLKDLLARQQPAMDLARLVEQKVKADNDRKNTRADDFDGLPPLLSPPTQFSLLSAIKHQDLQSIHQVLKTLPRSFVSIPDSATGIAPLHYALRLRPYKHPESEAIVRVLVALGANVNARNVKSGKTPLAYAVRDPSFFPDASRPPDKEEMERAAYSIVTFLLESGADVNAIDLDGNYALHYAARARDAELVRLLLSGGRAHAAVPNKKGKRPADVCEDEDIKGIIQQYLRKPSLHRESWSTLRLPYGPGSLEQALTDAQERKHGALKKDTALSTEAPVPQGQKESGAENNGTSTGSAMHVRQSVLPADCDMQLRLTEAKADAAEWKARFEQSRMQEKEALSLVKRLAECVGTDSGRSTLANVGLVQTPPRRMDGLEAALANAESSLTELGANDLEHRDVEARKRSLTSLRQKRTALLKEAGSAQKMIDEVHARLETAEQRIAVTFNGPGFDISPNPELAQSTKNASGNGTPPRPANVTSTVKAAADEELETALLSRLLVAAKDRLQQLKTAQAGLEADIDALRQKLLTTERDSQAAVAASRAKAEEAYNIHKKSEEQFRMLAARMLGLYPPSEIKGAQPVSIEDLELHVHGILPRLQYLVKDLGCRDPALDNQKLQVSSVNALRDTASVKATSPAAESSSVDQLEGRQKGDAVLEAADLCLLYVSSLLQWSIDRKRQSERVLAETNDFKKELEADGTVFGEPTVQTAPAAEHSSSLSQSERRLARENTRNAIGVELELARTDSKLEAPRSESELSHSAADGSLIKQPVRPTRESLSAGPLALVPSSEDVSQKEPAVDRVATRKFDQDAAAVTSKVEPPTNTNSTTAATPNIPSFSHPSDEGTTIPEPAPSSADSTSHDLLTVPTPTSEPPSGARIPTNTLERLHTTPELEELMNSIQRAKSAMSMADDTRCATPEGQVKRREYTDLVKTLINTMRSEDEGKPTRSPNGQRALRRPISPMPIPGAAAAAVAKAAAAAAAAAADRSPAAASRMSPVDPKLRSSFEDDATDDRRRGKAAQSPTTSPAVRPAPEDDAAADDVQRKKADQSPTLALLSTSISEIVAQKEGFPRPITEARPLPPRKLPPVARRSGAGPLPTLVEDKDKEEEEEDGRARRDSHIPVVGKRPGEKAKGGFFRRLMRSGRPA
ncbi:Ankyrin repeat domain-containing protein 22 [Geranomyces michiganensis]|nr:Ankyrin repeat domain-containing protein 22 [Geranomyces michiganensis]